MNKYYLVIPLFLLGCQKEQHWTLRECVTITGESFLYYQSSRESLLEEYPTIINREGIRDVNGWWRHEDTVLSCRDKSNANPR